MVLLCEPYGPAVQHGTMIHMLAVTTSLSRRVQYVQQWTPVELTNTRHTYVTTVAQHTTCIQWVGDYAVEVVIVLYDHSVGDVRTGVTSTDYTDTVLHDQHGSYWTSEDI